MHDRVRSRLCNGLLNGNTYINRAETQITDHSHTSSNKLQQSEQRHVRSGVQVAADLVGGLPLPGAYPFSKNELIRGLNALVVFIRDEGAPQQQGEDQPPCQTPFQNLGKSGCYVGHYQQPHVRVSTNIKHNN